MSRSSWLHILQTCHDLLFAKYFRINKTFKFVSRDFWWPQMWKFIKKIICAYVCLNKSTMPLDIWFVTPIPSWWKSMFIFFYGLHHKSPMLQMLKFHSCCGWLVDKDGAFYSNHQDHDKWKYYKTFFNDIYRYHGLPFDIV